MNVTKYSFDYSIFNPVSSAVISIFGLFGNSLVMFILTRRKFWKESLFRYLFFATIFDTVNGPFYAWMYNYKEFFLIDVVDISCKLSQFFGHFTYLVSPWINVIISVDTYFDVRLPTKFKFRKDIKFQFIIIIILIIIIALINVPYLLFLTVIPGLGCNTSLVTTVKKLESQLAILINTCFTVLLIVLPSILMFIFNCFTFFTLNKIKRISSSSDKKSIKRSGRLLKTTTVMNLLFVISYLPYRIARVFLIPLPTFAYSLLFLSESLFNSFNVIIYIISNRLFRKYFYFLFCLKLVSFRRNQQNDTR